MSDNFIVPDGNFVLAKDLPIISELIERTALWVNPETFHRLPVWAPHTARNRPLFDASWTRRYTNTRKATGVTSDKAEGNVAAIKALVGALGVASPKPKNWTVCHIWGYDDPLFSTGSPITQDPRYFTCVANLVWLPTSLKGFTDTLPEIKSMLRVCAFHLFGWTCEHASVEAEARKIRSGWTPEHYPASWPAPGREDARPIGTAPFSARVEGEILKRKRQMRELLGNPYLPNYPRDEVREVLRFWRISL